MKKVTLFATMLIAICLCACNNTSNENEPVKFLEKQKEEIVYNEHIQNHFFGFSFGDSPQMVKLKLDSVGLCTTDRLLPDGCMNLKPSYPQNDFQFGGFSWHYLHLRFSKNQLYAILFFHSFKTKEGAINMYKNVLSSLSTKYHLKEQQTTDTLTYGFYIGGTRTDQYVWLVCNQHEGWYGTELVYSDNNYAQSDSEL